MVDFPAFLANPGVWDRRQQGAVVKIIGPDLLDGRITYLGQHGTLHGVLQPHDIALVTTLDGHWVLLPSSCLYITPVDPAQAVAS